MITSVWRDEACETMQTKSLLRLSVDSAGDVHVHNFLNQPIFSGRMNDVELFFERAHVQNFKNSMAPDIYHPLDEGTLTKASDFFRKLPNDDVLGLWALLCVHKNTAPDVQRELLFSWPFQNFNQEFFLDKKGVRVFSGRVIDFVMGGVFGRGIELSGAEPNRLTSLNPRLFFHYHFKSDYHNDFDNNFVRKKSIDDFIDFACPAFLDVLKNDPEKIKGKFHVFFETDKTCQHLLKSTDFMAYWKNGGARDNGGFVLGSLINSSMGVREKQEAAKHLFRDIPREQILSSWKGLDIFGLQKKGLFRSWLAVAAGIGLSRDDAVQSAGFSLGDALAGRMKQSSEWLPFLPLFQKNGAFGDTKKHILTSYWEEISGVRSFYVETNNLLSLINPGLLALYEHGIMPKEFDFADFLMRMEETSKQYFDAGEDYQTQRQKTRDAGLAIIENFLISQHLAPVVSSKPQKTVRKM